MVTLKAVIQTTTHATNASGCCTIIQRSIGLISLTASTASAQ